MSTVIVKGKITSFEDTDFPLELNDEIEVLINLVDIEDEIGEYAEHYLDMVDEDDCECEISSFDDFDLICEIESRGYEIAEKETTIELDYKDSHMLQEITDKFYNSNLTEREEIWKKVV